jgi:tRNA A37 N6-isopentenylltransferase MiaA
MKCAQRRFARRQLTWMRRMEDVRRIDRTGRDDAAVAGQIAATLGYH